MKLKILTNLLKSNVMKNSEQLLLKNIAENRRLIISNLPIDIEWEMFIQRNKNFVKLIQ